ncbi:MAG: hypothetical protein HDQ97_05340 [Lachnospiraceae bacterium]|nr:hypothetical protein [Lachnospiraceae bacterium]
MSTTKLVLADGTGIELQGGAALGYMKAHYTDKAAMVSDWDKITPENLKTVQIKADETIIGDYADLFLESETSTLQPDGSVDTVWNIREKTEMEKLQDEIMRIREGQDIQDGAIADLGEAVSTLSEGGDE